MNELIKTIGFWKYVMVKLEQHELKFLIAMFMLVVLVGLLFGV